MAAQKQTRSPPRTRSLAPFTFSSIRVRYGSQTAIASTLPVSKRAVMAAGVELIRLMADSDRPFFLETSTRYMSFIEPNVVPTFFPLRSEEDTSELQS